MAVVIRKMVAADLPQVMSLLARWNLAPRPPSPETPDPERTTLHVENTYVAVDENRIVGVSSYIMHSAELAEACSVAVDPAYLGQGIGTRLVVTRLGEMRRRGVKTVRAEADRPETIRWMVNGLGYRIVGTNPKRHDFGSPQVDHWTVLELDLENFDPDRSKLR